MGQIDIVYVFLCSIHALTYILMLLQFGALQKSLCNLNLKDQFIQSKDEVENVPPVIESLQRKVFRFVVFVDCCAFS